MTFEVGGAELTTPEWRDSEKRQVRIAALAGGVLVVVMVGIVVWMP